MRKLRLLLLKLFIWLEFIWIEARKNAWSIIAIFLLYLLLWKFDQAQDLLLSLNQHKNLFRIFLAVPFFFGSLFIFSFLIWNIPIYMSDKNYKLLNIRNLFLSTLRFHYNLETKKSSARLVPREKLKLHINRYFSAILAINAMLMSAFAIINSMIDFRIILISKLWMNLFFIGFCLYFILLLNLNFYIANTKFFLHRWIKLIVFNFIFPFLLILIIGLGVLNYTTMNQPIKMTFLFISQLSSTALFVMLVFGKNYIEYRMIRNFIFRFLSSGVLVFVILFISLNLFISFNPTINPLVVFVSALIFYLVFIFILKWIGKLYKIPLFTIILFSVILLSFNSQQQKSFEHYAISTETYGARDRINLESYVKNWIDQREDLILNSNGYPLYFVSSQGGGSKGGLWSALVLGHINSKTNGKFFDDHLFSLTGASGGSVGNGLFFAEASQNRGSFEFREFHSKDSLKTKIGEFYKNNYLSSSVSGLLGRDLWQSSLGISFTKNRGEILADEWEKNFARTHENNQILLKKDFLSFYKDKNADLPLLIINTTHIQSGRYCYISPVKFETKAYLDFYEVLDSCECANESIKLSTALALNASFPLINSVGDIRGCSKDEALKGGQLADAGYYDNIGGTISQFLYDEVESQLQERGLLSKVKMQNLVLVNDNYNYDINPKTLQNVNQLLIPLHSITQVRSGHTYQTSRFLSDPVFLYMDYFQKDEKRNEFKPIIPLGRYLSETAVGFIESQIMAPTNDKKLNFIIQDITQN